MLGIVTVFDNLKSGFTGGHAAGECHYSFHVTIGFIGILADHAHDWACLEVLFEVNQTGCDFSTSVCIESIVVEITNACAESASF